MSLGFSNAADYRTTITFCVKLNKSATETLAMFQEAYGKGSLKAQEFRGHKAFKDERVDVNDKQSAGVHKILKRQTMFINLKSFWTLIVR